MNSLSRTKSVCSFLGISRGTLAALRRDGMPVVYVQKSIRYELEEILRWLKSNKPTVDTKQSNNKEIKHV